MRWPYVWWTFAVAACSVNVDNPADHPDAAKPPRDAASDTAAVDAPPADVRLCAGGDNHASDTATGACFLFFTGPKTRADAQADCVAHQSQLAIVRSAQQNAIVQSIIGASDAFLGATDAINEGAYLWPDNTGFTFTNFRAGEPNNGGGQFQEDCLVIEGSRGGSWDDRPCAPPPAGSGAYGYVCEF
jgi:hypothetical protein